MTQERVIAMLKSLIQSQEIMIEEHIDAEFLAEAQAALSDALALLAALTSGDAAIIEFKAST